MRDKITPEEDEIRKYLTKYLETNSPNLIFDPSITDKPDIVFEIDGKRIGCEFVGISIEESYLHGKTDAGEDKWQVIKYPLEPYFIFNELIKKKLALYPSYQTRAKTQTIWLLIHDPLVKRMFIPYTTNHKEFVEKWFYFIAGNRPSPFGRILYLRSDRSTTDIIGTSYSFSPIRRSIEGLFDPQGIPSEIDRKIKIRGIDAQGRAKSTQIDFSKPNEKVYQVGVKFKSLLEIKKYLRDNGCLIG